MRELKIYTLSDSRDPNNIRYVGKTVEKLSVRLSGHLHDAKYKTSKPLHYWILSVLNANASIIIEELDYMEIENNYNWDWLEQYWISQVKAWGFSLFNISAGGQGTQGFKYSREVIEKRASKIRGIPRDEATRRKIAESNKGKPKSELHKKHVKDSMTEQFGVPIVQLTKDTMELIAEYPSISIAAETLHKTKANIAKCCKHVEHFNTAYGYKWMYKSEYIVWTSTKVEDTSE